MCSFRLKDEMEKNMQICRTAYNRVVDMSSAGVINLADVISEMERSKDAQKTMMKLQSQASVLIKNNQASPAVKLPAVKKTKTAMEG